jgi:hypothetical protein
MSELSMTVRTYAAIHVLPAVLIAQTKPYTIDLTAGIECPTLTMMYAARVAVQLADALIAELAKEYDHEA